MKEVVKKWISDLSKEFGYQANFPQEQGETWSWENYTILKSKIQAAFELGHSFWEAEDIVNVLYYYHNELGVDEKHQHCYNWLVQNKIITPR